MFPRNSSKVICGGPKPKRQRGGGMTNHSFCVLPPILAAIVRASLLNGRISLTQANIKLQFQTTSKKSNVLSCPFDQTSSLIRWRYPPLSSDSIMALLIMLGWPTATGRSLSSVFLQPRSGLMIDDPLVTC